ncbi:zinc ABC transporter substrate-binding protein [Solirubrobacter sp. CPCC 204708]|uniref:Metal ABC transporter substrate-binding protein n=1 Tax=Solirubrobacter deserti TaxID=2282478 RepID=A0ABT4RPE1_9ACTN|nr:metal ABC transporter substrate-binding protein [Solirubrobacter deserti]MBE2315750.1 zinc ABC transporter substrate-binding protein [Solirubrobacter deserti]MDA0140360.1 metal ABC transporter substrate-binding protein [Solirubrobacter deserti]
MRKPVAALLLTVPLLFAACGGEDEPAAGGGASAAERPLVVASTPVVADIVRQVAGDAAEVKQVMSANADPHDYEPRPDDVKAVAGAKVVIESGNDLDHWMEELVEQTGEKPAELVIAPDHTPHKVKPAEGGHGHGEEEEHAGEEEEHAGEEEEHAGEWDPHWWHDPRNVETAVAAIRDELVKSAPENADAYRTNADAYLKKVQALDAGIEACMNQVPAQERKLVTSHDAFGYFTERYGITTIGAATPSNSASAQPSAGELAELADVIRREKVKAVFPESAVNPELAQTIARQTGAKADYVLYGDTLGPEGSPGATYLQMEQANAHAMVKGFTGDAQGCTIAGL